MAHINIDGVQNVQVSKPIGSEKSPQEQLALMEKYTDTYQRFLTADKARREVECLKVIYPTLFRHVESGDLIAGRLDFLPIGFGCVTSVGGVGHYCVFHKLRAFRETLATDAEKTRVDRLYDFWQDHDLKTLYCQDILGDATTGFFMQYEPPYMATARLSGMMLDYQKLVDVGIGGLMDEVRTRIDQTDARGEKNEFLLASLDALKLFQTVVTHEVDLCHVAQIGASPKRAAQLELMAQDLNAIRECRPQTFHQALQLVWLYALCAGCINYGCLDTVLGPYLKHDLDTGTITEQDAYDYVHSLWTLIENRRTTVNGRVIVGGMGRPDPEAADTFARVCLKVCKDCRYVEPQFTLRFDHSTPEDIKDMAYDAIGAGATYPTLYNDDVEVPAVEYGMRVPRKVAEQYVPFGCTEFVIQGKSVGTPNTLINLAKLLSMSLNGGIDP